METIRQEELSKSVKEVLQKALPGLHFFTYPMDRQKFGDDAETAGLLIHTTFLGQDVVSHLRFPLTSDGEFLVGDLSEVVSQTVSAFVRAVTSAVQSLGATQGIDLSFGEALVALHYGARVTRVGWNGRGMLLAQVPGSSIRVEEGRPLAACFPVGEVVEYLPHIDMKTADGKVVPWTCSQTDMQAMDWRLV